MSAFQCLGNCSEDLCSIIEEPDVAHGKHSPGVKGVGIGVLTPPLNSPGNWTSHRTSVHLSVPIGKRDSN